MSKIKDVVIDDINFKTEQQTKKYIENLQGQIAILEEIVQIKNNLISSLENDILKLNDILAQIKTIIEKVYG